MVLVDDDVLRIVDLTGDQPVARGTVRLPGWGQEILVVGDRVLAFGSNEEAYYAEDVASTWSPYGATTSVLSEIDLSDPDNPTIVHSLELDSAYLSARLIGETARLLCPRRIRPSRSCTRATTAPRRGPSPRRPTAG